MRQEAGGKRQEAGSKSAICNLQSADCHREAGDSLIEVLAAVAIISMALVVFISALSTGAFGVRHTNRLTTATNLAANQLESIKAASYWTGTAAYPVIPAGAYTISQTISYWNGATFTSDPAADEGMQWITVTVFHQGEMLVTVSNYKVER